MAHRPPSGGIGRRGFVAGMAAAPALAAGAGHATGRPAPAATRVDAGGVWRWGDGREVALFGVNYDLPSASAFRFAKASGMAWADIIAADFAHFRRLRFDGLRLCFWGDWENSRADGTLVENEHLAVLDAAIAAAREHGIACLFSPIVTYDASWPDAMAAPRDGISHAFRKEALGTDARAIAAQARFLREILARTNPRTGTRYADEPAIVAVELINEPVHKSRDRAGSIRYIDTLAAAVRTAGFAGPIVHNVSQDMGIAPAIAASRAEIASFAWYPTGLQTGRAVEGNGLLLVDRYPQPRDPALGACAKLVYEFDAADSLASYYYPAMVRAFREGGAQFAAMFAYDALPIAAANSEFNDHFLNLAYTPAKAISAMIAACAMRELPRLGDHGSYPRNMRFGAFHVDDRADLSELVDRERFFHSNDTGTTPPAPAALRHLAGCGGSPLVDYDGTGAWFLDRVADGVWRLELHPDAAIVDNPFVFRRPQRPAVRIVHRARRFRTSLPDLGDHGVERAGGGSVRRQADGAVALLPGVYRLVRRGATPVAVDARFHTAPADRFPPAVLHTPPRSRVAGTAWPIAVDVIAPEPPRTVTLHPRGGPGIALEPTRGFRFEGVVPAAAMREGYLDYHLVARMPDGAAIVTPAADGTLPGDWDFPRTGGFRVPVVPPDAPLTLFDAGQDGERLIVPYGGYAQVPGISLRPHDGSRTVVRLDGAMLAKAAEQDLPAQLAWNGPLDAGGRAPERFAALTVEGRATGAGPVAVALIERDGTAWGTTLTLPAEHGPVTARLSSLRVIRMAMLPRDFPVGINPYWLRTPQGRGAPGDRLRIAELQAVQVALGRRFLGGEAAAPVIEIGRILLQR